jgi:hypothetical protein
MLLVATGISSATTVVLDATKQGAVFTTFLLPGGTVTSVDLPVIQLSLAAGTYAITDGDTSGTGSAWNFSSGSGSWVWDFAVVNDATKVVLLNDYIGTAPGTLTNFSTRALAAQATGAFYNGNTLLSTTSTALFSATLFLGSPTTVDFLIPDVNVSDNLGGMTLNVTQVQTGVPEPASFLLVATALAAGCLRLRRRAR